MKKSTEIVKVLYIVGVGRSGSTILDTLLGNHPEIESVGELINVNRAGWINNEYCSCHKRANNCDFWNAVKEVWQEKTGLKDLNEYRDLQNLYEFRLYKPTAILQSAQSNPQSFERFLHLTEMLFQAISTISGCRIIVDSSKSRTRAFLLSRIHGLDMRYIHLIRDTRDIIKSLRKAHRPNPEEGIQHHLKSLPGWRTSLSWVLTNLQSQDVLKRYARDDYAMVRYEDLLESPEIVLAKIGILLDTDLSEIIKAAEDGSKLDVGHTIAGNRLRMKQEVSFQRKHPGPLELGLLDSLSFKVLAYWLARQYGYPFVRH